MWHNSVLLLFLGLLPTALGVGYENKKNVITHDGLDKELCRNSHDCSYDEKCEKVCFWEQYTRDWVGCTVACVKRDAHPRRVTEHPHVFPFPAPIPEEEKPEEPKYPPPEPPKHHQPPSDPKYPPTPPKYPPQPKYPPPQPKYPPQQPKYPPPRVDKHKQACGEDEECGYNQKCNRYKHQCECIYGFVPDPHFPGRCITTSPHYSPPQYPPKIAVEPKYPPKPPKESTCRSAHDCRYGEKCCYWRKCNSYGNCIVKYMCAAQC